MTETVYNGENLFPEEIRMRHWRRAAALLLTTAVIYVPFLVSAFGFTSISLIEYAVALLLAFLVIPLVELVKLMQRRFGKRK